MKDVLLTMVKYKLCNFSQELINLTDPKSIYANLYSPSLISDFITFNIYQQKP